MTDGKGERQKYNRREERERGGKNGAMTTRARCTQLENWRMLQTLKHPKLNRKYLFTKDIHTYVHTVEADNIM